MRVFLRKSDVPHHIEAARARSHQIAESTIFSNRNVKIQPRNPILNHKFLTYLQELKTLNFILKFKSSFYRGR